MPANGTTDEAVAEQSDPPIDADGGEQSSFAGQLRNFLRPCLLLLLDEAPTYGYELQHQLTRIAPGRWDHGTIYRLLNLMEEEGLVASTWQRSSRGPRRRAYRVTECGQARLREYAREMSTLRNVLVVFLDRYERDLEARVALLLRNEPSLLTVRLQPGDGATTSV